MNEVYVVVLLLPMVGLLAAGACPSGWVNRHTNAVRSIISRLAALHLTAAVIALGWTVAFGSIELSPVLLDGTSTLMLSLVGFVGWIICRYSIRHLDGDANQGRYFRWTALTIGSVSLLVVAGNLLVMLVAWGLTGFGIHQLLLHNPDRPEAQRAAWTKFVFSRVGDVLLIAGGVVLYLQSGTLNLTVLFAESEAAGPDAAGSFVAFGWLLVAGIILKTVQFPFHTWLPDTMEAPTPVSALMHAGIVNAGGYVLIRTSPLLIHATAAMTWLAVSGAVTACLAALVMLTQSSVKRSLAYSTISQMGFMLLQCGLGAFSAAMLHLIAHSLYKAHAFLSSGSVLRQPAAGQLLVDSHGKRFPRFARLAGSFVVTVALFVGVALVLGMQPTAKPGAFLLGAVLCMGLTRWLWQLTSFGNRRLILAAVATTILLSVVYVTSFQAVDYVVNPVPWQAASGLVAVAVGVITGLCFGGLLAVDMTLTCGVRSRWLDELYVHASNGFYIDAVVRRIGGFVRT